SPSAWLVTRRCRWSSCPRAGIRPRRPDAACSTRAGRPGRSRRRSARADAALLGLLRPGLLDRPEALTQIASEDRFAAHGHERGADPTPHTPALAHHDQVDVRPTARARGEGVYPAALRYPDIAKDVGQAHDVQLRPVEAQPLPPC